MFHTSYSPYRERMDRRFVGRGGPADLRINPRHDVQTLAANGFVTTYVGNELRGQFQGPHTLTSPTDSELRERSSGVIKSDRVLSSSGSSLDAGISDESGAVHSGLGCPGFRRDNSECSSGCVAESGGSCRWGKTCKVWNVM